MTGVLPFAEWLDELQQLIETKDNPEEWYILQGKHVGEYSVHAAETPEELQGDTEPPEGFGDATENVDGFYQIGTMGWAEAAIDDDIGFVGEVGFSESAEPIDRRLNGILLVHESVLSAEATEKSMEATA